MRRPLLMVLAVAVTGAALFLAACGTAGEEDGNVTLELAIGDIVPLTGDLADLGHSGQKAADLAIDEITAAIKEVGADHTVKIRHAAEHPVHDAALAAPRKFAEEGASCITGAWASQVTIDVAQSVSIPEGILQISPASTSPELTGLQDDGLLNRVPPADDLEGRALADLVQRELGGAEGKVVAVGGRDDPDGEALTRSFVGAWESRGGEVAGGMALLWDPQQATFDSEAEELVSERPDAYMIADIPETFRRIGPALLRTGEWEPAKTFVPDRLLVADLVGDAGSAEFTDGLRGTAPGAPDGENPSEAFDRLYASEVPKDVDRQRFAAQSFDAVILCYLAAVAAQSTDGAEMALELGDVTGPDGDEYTWEELPDAIEALEDGDDIDYIGAAGEIDLDVNGDSTVGVYDTLEARGGELVPAGKQIPAEAEE